MAYRFAKGICVLGTLLAAPLPVLSANTAPAASPKINNPQTRPPNLQQLQQELNSLQQEVATLKTQQKKRWDSRFTTQRKFTRVAHGRRYSWIAAQIDGLGISYRTAGKRILRLHIAANRQAKQILVADDVKAMIVAGGGLPLQHLSLALRIVEYRFHNRVYLLRGEAAIPPLFLLCFKCRYFLLQ